MSQSKSFPIGFWQRVFLVAPLFPKWGHRSGWIHIFYLTQILYQVLLFFVFVFCYITIPFIQTWDQHLDYHMPPEPGFVSAPGIGTIQTTTLWGHLFSIDSHVKIHQLKKVYNLELNIFDLYGYFPPSNQLNRVCFFTYCSRGCSWFDWQKCNHSVFARPQLLIGVSEVNHSAVFVLLLPFGAFSMEIIGTCTLV